MLAGPGILGTLTFAPIVLALFYSSKFVGAAPVLQWFCLGITLRVIRGDSMVGVTNGERVAIDRGGAVHRTPLAGDDRIRFLVEEAGLSEEIARTLPADVPPPA